MDSSTLKTKSHHTKIKSIFHQSYCFQNNSKKTGICFDLSKLRGDKEFLKEEEFFKEN